MGISQTSRRAHASGRSAACVVEAVERRVLMSGTPVPVGDEFQVNTYTAGDQGTWRQSVDTDAAGNFVVTWQSTLQDGGGRGVYAQRFSADGTSLGGEFRVNTYTAGEQTQPAVAVDAAGNFVITWQSQQDPRAKGEKTASYGIYAQRYDSLGVPQGNEFRVNTTTADHQLSSSVASDDAGNFVVTWASNKQDPAGQGREYTNYGVYAQRYDAAGQKLGGEFRVNTYTPQDQNQPTVAMNGSGEFVVAWQSSGQDGSLWGVYAQKFTAAGSTVGREVQVNTSTAGPEQVSDVAIAPGGEFFVGWSRKNETDSSYDAYARLFSAAAAPLTGELRLHDDPAGRQVAPTIANDSRGGWTTAWTTYGADGSGYGISGRQFDAAGKPAGDEFSVNKTTAGDQHRPSLAAQPDGKFVAAWTSTGQDNPDGSEGVYARLFQPPATVTATTFSTTSISDSTAIEEESSGTTSVVELIAI